MAVRASIVLAPTSIREVEFDYSASLGESETISSIESYDVVSLPGAPAALQASAPTPDSDNKKVKTEVTVPETGRGHGWILTVTVRTNAGSRIPLSIEILSE